MMHLLANSNESDYNKIGKESSFKQYCLDSIWRVAAVLGIVRIWGVGPFLIFSIVGLASGQEVLHGLAWSLVFPGDEQGWAECLDVAIDPNGYGFVAGRFDGKLGATAQALVSEGGADLFIARLSPYGQCQWIEAFGGPWDEILGGIGVDPNGNLYLTGAFRSRIDVDPGPSMATRTASGLADGLVCKVRPDGRVGWAATIGGAEAQVAVGDIAVDDTGLYITGLFSGRVDFDPGPGLDVRSPRGYISTFVSRWDLDGRYVWTQVIGGTLYTKASSICLTRQSGLYVGGTYNCPADFDPGPGVDYRPFHGDWDVFVTRLDRDGRYVWTGNLSGAGYDILCGLAAGPGDQVLVAGAFSLLVDLDPTEGEDYRFSDHQCVGAGFIGNWPGDGGYNWTYTDPDPSLQSAAVAAVMDHDGLTYALFEQVQAGASKAARSSLILTTIDPMGRRLGSVRWDSVVEATVMEDEPLFWPGQWAVALGTNGDLLIAGRFSGAVDLDPGQQARVVCSKGATDGVVLCLQRRGIE